MNKETIFEEPQIFSFNCIASYYGDDENDYEYPEYDIKAYSYDDAFSKLNEVMQEYIDNYDEELYYSSDWEVSTWRIVDTDCCLDFDLTKTN